MSSWGTMSPNEVQAAMNAPYGKATQIIRNHDPLFGMRGDGSKRYAVTVSQTITRTRAARFEVEAGSEEHAEDLALKMAEHDRQVEWLENYNDDYGDYEIENTKELEG